MKPTIHAPAVPARTHKQEPWRERDQIIELIAIFKFVKVAGLLAITFGLLHLFDPAVGAKLQSWVFALSESAAHPHILRGLKTVTSLSERQIQTLGVIALAYATLYMIEGIGLWHQSRWAEYLTIVATSLLIPLEIYEITRRVTVPRVTALIVNVAAVIYLIYRLRHEDEKTRIV
jgi:uncharacterized membrane protein (DUF2068 family)